MSSRTRFTEGRLTKAGGCGYSPGDCIQPGDNHMKKTLTCLALASLAMTGPAFAAKYFKWVDSKGVTHYSETPPPSDATETSQVRVQTRLPSDSESAVERLQKQRAEALKGTSAAPGSTPAAGNTPATDAPKADKSQYAERCKQLRANLEVLQNSARIREENEKGEVRALTDEEKKQRMDDTQRQIKAFCE